jgi:hypothetical protein
MKEEFRGLWMEELEEDSARVTRGLQGGRLRGLFWVKSCQDGCRDVDSRDVRGC